MAFLLPDISEVTLQKHLDIFTTDIQVNFLDYCIITYWQIVEQTIPTNIKIKNKNWL